MPSSLVTYSIVVFPLPSLILSYWTVLCCVIMPDLPSCQSCLSARTTWENLGMVLGSITAGVSAMQLCSNSMTLLHIHLGCRYLFPEWCLHSLHFRTSFILIIHVFFFALVIGCHWSLGYWQLHCRIWRIVRTPSDPCSQRPGSGMFNPRPWWQEYIKNTRLNEPYVNQSHPLFNVDRRMS